MSRAISLWLDLGSDIAAKTLKERLNSEAKETLKSQQATLALIHAEVHHSSTCCSIMALTWYSYSYYTIVSCSHCSV